MRTLVSTQVVVDGDVERGLKHLLEGLRLLTKTGTILWHSNEEPSKSLFEATMTLKVYAESCVPSASFAIGEEDFFDAPEIDALYETVEKEQELF